jgi:hypothetical protein
MKCTVHHKQDRSYRVVCFGTSWYVQTLSNTKGTQTSDPWFTIGTAKDSQEAAVQAMYVFKPLVQP